jgi:rare lipoprotein A
MRPLLQGLLVMALAAALAGCGSSGAGKRGGGHYKDDGPHANPPSNLDQVPNAVPRVEPYANGPSRPYTVFGKRYVPDLSNRPYKVRGRASWYGKKFHGNATSSGERYDMYGMTAAHTTLPIPSYVRVTSTQNGKTVILRVNDRGPFHADRIIDLSYVAAHKLDIIGPGSGEVTVERITHEEIRRGTWSRSETAAALTPVPDSSSVAAAETSLSGVALSPLVAHPQPPETHTDMAADTGVYLQLGAFSQPANAQALAARLERELAGAEAPHSSTDQRGALHRVRVGPFPNRAEAVTAAEGIYQRTGIMPAISAP